MIALDDFEALRRKVEAARRRRDEAAGALASVNDQLKKEFGCATVDDARDHLAELEADMHAKAAVYAKAKKEFEAEYAAVLTEMESRRG